MTTKEGNKFIFDYLKKYGWCVYCGIVSGIFGVDILTFILIYIPLVYLVWISKKKFLQDFIDENSNGHQGPQGPQPHHKKDLDFFR